MILYDPVSGEELTVYSITSDEVYRNRTEAVVNNLASYYGISIDEVVRLLQNSDIDNPIVYYDQIFWCEAK